MKRLLLLLLVNWMCDAAFAARNVLLIIADDYGVDSSVLYNSTNTGASLPPTPNIASLAQAGVVFGNAYANPLCSPTRCCIMTGRHAFRTGVGDVIVGVNDPRLMQSEFTLPDAFAANPGLGYQLAMFGKWHLGGAAPAPANLGGWAHFAGSLQGAIASYTNWTKVVNGVSTANYTNYATTDVVNDAIAWIQARGAQPWFAWVAFNAGHTPLHKPTNSLHSYDSLAGTQDDITANPRPYYEAMIEAMDTEIGRLLSAVNRTNTEIVFVGDNGSDGSVIQAPFVSNRAKATLYEGGIKVPMVIAGPAVTNPGRTNNALVHVVDIYSTILDLAGISLSSTVPTNTTLDSRSLVPILTSTPDLTRYAYAELFNTNAPALNDGQILRNTQFKLLKFHNGREEFYDLLADPTERTNLLSGTMNATQQANYYSLTMKLASYQDTLSAPVIMSSTYTNQQFTATVQAQTNRSFSLWSAATLDDLAWAPLASVSIQTNTTTVSLTHTNAIDGQRFYRVKGTLQ